MKLNSRLGLVAMAIILGTTIGYSQTVTETVSINWKQFAGAINDVGDGYGVVAANNWQNLQQVRTGTDLLGSSGIASTVDFDLVDGSFNTYYGGLDNTPMRTGAIVFHPAEGDPLTLTLTLSDLNATFDSYDVIVYLGGFTGNGNAGSISDGATTYYIAVPDPLTTSLLQSTDTNQGDGISAGTYVRFNGLTADTTTITYTTIAAGAGIAGVQITGPTAVPEPGTFALVAGCCALGFLLNRRRKQR